MLSNGRRHAFQMMRQLVYVCKVLIVNPAQGSMRQHYCSGLGGKEGLPEFGVCKNDCTALRPSGYINCDSFFLDLIQTRVVLREGTLVEKMAPLDWPIGKSVKHFLED